MPGARRTARPDQAAAVTGQRYGLRHRPAGAGQLTGVRRRARRASARQGAAGRRPTVCGWPTAPRSGRWWRSVCQSRILPDDFALAAPIRPGGPDGWRAAGAPLKPYRRSAQIRVRVPLSVFPVLTSGATPPGKRLRLGAVPGGGLAAYGPAPPPARAPQDPFQPLRGKHLEAPPLRAEPLRTLGQESRAGSSLPQPARGPHPPP